MTVAELIELLKCCPPDQLVVTNGYEGGYTEVTEEKVRQVETALGPKPIPYCGEYSNFEYYQDEDDTRELMTVLLISRSPR